MDSPCTGRSGIQHTARPKKEAGSCTSFLACPDIRSQSAIASQQSPVSQQPTHPALRLPRVLLVLRCRLGAAIPSTLR
eukprot:353887-Chlamydomonas_euryale.AAC.3